MLYDSIGYAFIKSEEKIFKARKRRTRYLWINIDIYSGPQYVAAIGRNQYGFETRASKSFEHLLSVLLGREIFSHILNQDSDRFRAEELTDDGLGLAGDLSEEDILDLKMTHQTIYYHLIK